jgi:hypothetical protein
MGETEYPDQFADFMVFLCEKYSVDRNRLFVEYSSRSPPPLKGTRAGYYEGLLSYREKNGHVEFLITVFKASREPLLTLAHEFGHLVKNLKSGNFDKHLTTKPSTTLPSSENLIAIDPVYIEIRIPNSLRTGTSSSQKEFFD